MRAGALSPFATADQHLEEHITHSTTPSLKGGVDELNKVTSKCVLHGFSKANSPTDKTPQI